MDVVKKIGKRLQEQRKKKGYTQERFSEMIGVSPNYLSAVERGVNQLNYEALVHAMNLLDCSADDIFRDVVTRGLVVQSCELNEKLKELDPAERARILTVLDTLIATAKQK
ncbi:MAG: helix-turn-helix transcriptional regulator [Clostridia bacterium]|nr:helix-turn-helix transcriptional regulator [Clostridia bacterium]